MSAGSLCQKTVTERTKREIYKDKIYSPIYNRLIHDEAEPAAEDPGTIRLPANMETQKTDVRMGRAQDESGILWITAIFIVKSGAKPDQWSGVKVGQ